MLLCLVWGESYYNFHVFKIEAADLKVPGNATLKHTSTGKLRILTWS